MKIAKGMITFMKSIGFKLTAIMLCVILLGIIIAAGAAIFISNNVVTREAISKVTMNNYLEANKLDSWLSNQTSSITTMADMMASMSSVNGILAANQTDDGASLEEQVVDTLRPLFRSVLDDNAAYFEVYMGFLDGTAVAGSGYQFDYATWTSYERGWYKLALTDTSKAHVTSPYVDAQTGELCITVVKAVVTGGKLIGVMAADIYVNVLQNITLAANLDSTGYSMLIDTNGDVLVHPDKDYAPNAKGDYTNMNTVKNGVHAALWQNASAADGVYKYKDADTTTKYFFSSTLPTTGWCFISVLPTKVVTQPITTLIVIVIPVTVVILVLAVVLIFITIRNLISRPLAPLTIFMNKAGTTGDISLSREDEVVIGKYSSREDEIGQCIKGAAMFVNRISEVEGVLESIADGDLTSNIALLSESDEMGKHLRTVLDNLSGMFKDLNDSSVQVSSGAKQVADGAQSLAQGSTEQAASIEELSSSISDIALKTKANADMANRASKLADTIRGNAEKGNQQMDEMIGAVKDINQASQNISKVIKVIDDIAFQTNILALNAAVEAARAGQHGKGFAVVAEEVRNLASKSAEAARDTGTMIQDSMTKAELGTRIAGDTASSLSDIVSGINESSKFISEIAKSSEEQSLGITQINIGIDQVAQVVQQNSATAEESAAASEEMSSQSALLQELVSQFKLKDEYALPAHTPGRYR